MVRPTLAHGVMVVAGLVTFVLVASVLRDRAATTPVVVAAAVVEAGTPVERLPIEVVDVDAGSALVQHLAGPDRLVAGLVVDRRLAPGEPVLERDLVPADRRAGQRTVVVPVERLVLDGLALEVEDRVDVIGVAGDGTAALVAADVGVARLPEEAPLGLGRAETATTWLTVAVSEQQALDVAGALAGGRIVVVRSTGAPRAAGSAVGGDPVDTATAVDAGS